MSTVLRKCLRKNVIIIKVKGEDLKIGSERARSNAFENGKKTCQNAIK
jgi:hypothetical protein